MTGQRIDIWEHLSPAERTTWHSLTAQVLPVKELMALYCNDDSFSQLSRLDNLVLKLSERVALAPLCYRQWRKDVYNDNSKISVIPDSYDPKRGPIIASTLRWLAAKYDEGAKSHRTLKRDLAESLWPFFEFCNSKGFPADISTAQSHLRKFTDLLLHEVKIYDRQLCIGLSTQRASMRQSAAIGWLVAHLGIPESSVAVGMRRIKKNIKQVKPTQPMHDEVLAQHFSFYTALFRQLADIVLDAKPLPCSIQLLDETLWLAPHQTYVKPEHRIDVDGMQGFNYQTGKPYSLEQLITQGKTKYQAQTIVKNCRNSIIRSKQPFSMVRRRIVGWACQAYFMHFLTLTGENDSTAASQLFDGEYEVERAEQHFRNLKLRAGGKPVTYQLQNEFMPDFRRYIALRDYLLRHLWRQDSPYPYLFIKGVTKGVVPHQLTGEASRTIRANAARTFTGKLADGGSRQTRVTKGLWIRKEAGSQVAAYILQHNVPTANQSYTGRNEETATDELTDFFEHVHAALTKAVTNDQDTATGHCGETGKPKLMPGSPVDVDCKQGEGCLFCAQYRPHADEADCRKLLSLRYLIDLSKDNAADQAHFQRVFEPVLARIDTWLDAFREKDTSITPVVERVKVEVYEHEQLTPFWYRKLEMLQDLGVL